MPFNRPIQEPRPRTAPSSGIKSLVQAEKLMQIAILLPSSAFIGWLAGAWLDSRLHQGWIGLVGILFGGISGLVYVVRLVLSSGKSYVSETKVGDGSEPQNPEIRP
jgi:hypothetical protein